MSITSIHLVSENQKELPLDLRATTAQSRYIIRNIVGLDADEIIPKFYGFSDYGTKKFYDFQLKTRELVMRIVLNPRYGLGESNKYIRDELYRLISAGRTGIIDVVFHEGGTVVSKLVGQIVKFEVAYFSSEPELQVTIRCNDPLFRGVTPVVMDVNALPDANPILVTDDQSTAPHGFALQATCISPTYVFSIRPIAFNGDWEFRVESDTQFLVGDILYMSSEANNKYIYMVRSGVTTHLLNHLRPPVTWPVLFPGENSLWCPSITKFRWDSLTFTPAFWGV